jgi:hypothetical protein
MLLAIDAVPGSNSYAGMVPAYGYVSAGYIAEVSPGPKPETRSFSSRLNNGDGLLPESIGNVYPPNRTLIGECDLPTLSRTMIAISLILQGF